MSGSHVRSVAPLSCRNSLWATQEAQSSKLEAVRRTRTSHWAKVVGWTHSRGGRSKSAITLYGYLLAHKSSDYLPDFKDKFFFLLFFGAHSTQLYNAILALLRTTETLVRLCSVLLPLVACTCQRISATESSTLLQSNRIAAASVCVLVLLLGRSKLSLQLDSELGRLLYLSDTKYTRSQCRRLLRAQLSCGSELSQPTESISRPRKIEL